MNQRVRMVAYVGWRRETEVEVDVEIIGGIAGKARCFECKGVPAAQVSARRPPACCRSDPLRLGGLRLDQFARHRWRIACRPCAPGVRPKPQPKSAGNEDARPYAGFRT
jgi:hypothetical protein